MEFEFQGTKLKSFKTEAEGRKWFLEERKKYCHMN